MEEKRPGMMDHIQIDPDQELDVFVDEKLFTVSMSGFFAKRLQTFGDWIMNTQKPEKMLEIYNSLIERPDDVPTDILTYNVQTYLMLMQAVRSSAIEAGATTKMKYKDIQASVQNTTELGSDLDT